MPIVYLAETPAGALLETCVHTSANDVPPSYILLEIAVAENVSIEELELTTLPSDWANNLDISREIGTQWLRSLRSPLLRVPSALVPATFNVLLNPLHPGAAQIEIVAFYDYPFDSRIKK